MHIPVLLHETVQLLAPKKGGVVLDGTAGGGGHAAALCDAVGAGGTVVALDEDARAVSRTKKKLKHAPCTSFIIAENFRNLDTVFKRLKLRHADAVVFDLGLSSYQLREGDGRGFSFQADEPLIMTFRTSPRRDAFNAGEIVNTWDEENIAAIIEGYGQDRFARRIARAICRAREEGPIRTTHELAAIVAGSIPRRFQRKGIHPATQTFQALRIAVNDEIGALKEGLEKAFALLSSHGRIAVISFHSIEDRVVKLFFREKEAEGLARRITKKPEVPSALEIRKNPRARSAKLRVLEKL